MTLRNAAEDGVVIELPFSEDLVASPGSGIIHSGAITTLMDTTCGYSVVASLPNFEVCPTLDLRIDHLGLPDPFEPVKAFAEVYRITPSIVFTRSVAYQQDRTKPFAHAVGTFMRRGSTSDRGGLQK